MKQLKDYLHFYLGCEIQTENGISVLESIDDNGLVGDEDRDESGEGWYHIDDIKPILRPLSDITGVEKEDAMLPMYEQTRYLLSKHFDLFGLIEAGLAIDKTKL